MAVLVVRPGYLGNGQHSRLHPRHSHMTLHLVNDSLQEMNLEGEGRGGGER